ncbi:hypothetical protein EV175_002159 [Coemansia sp. RSA 1933]|nr:hypothetical protein EV175_002159 [Coemansia sp. RSA 1933]
MFSRENVQSSLQTILATVNMARDSKGSWIAKNSHRIPNKADHNRRSFVVKTLHGNAPVMMRQGEWYQDAYPESEMFLCPRGCVSPTIMISDEWRQDSETALKRDKKSRRANIRGNILGPQSKKASIQQQFLEQIEFSYSWWKERNNLQISREEESEFTSRRRRQIVKQPQIRRSSDTRTAAVPPIPRPWGDDDPEDPSSVAHSILAKEFRVVRLLCLRSLPPLVRITS